MRTSAQTLARLLRGRRGRQKVRNPYAVLSDDQVLRAFWAAKDGEPEPEDVRAIFMAQPRDPRLAHLSDAQVLALATAGDDEDNDNEEGS